MSTPKIKPVSRVGSQSGPEPVEWPKNSASSPNAEAADKIRPDHLRAVDENEARDVVGDPVLIGDLFRRSREKYGLSLEDVEADLCIRKAYLRAIENEDFKQLPGTTYAVGFVRAYADLVDLDAEDMVRRFKEKSAASPPPIAEPKRKKGRAAPHVSAPPPKAKPRPSGAPIRVSSGPPAHSRGAKGRLPVGRAIAAGLLLGVAGVVAFVLYAIFAGGEEGGRIARTDTPAGTASPSNGAEGPAAPASLEVKVDYRHPAVTDSGPDELARDGNPPIASGQLWPERTSSLERTSVSIGLETGGADESDGALFKPRPKLVPSEIAGRGVVGPATPAGNVAETGATSPRTGGPVAETASTPAQPAQPGPEPAAEEAAPAESEVAARPVEPPPPGNTYGASPSESRVTFTAKERTQIRIHSTTGEVLFDGVLQPGDSYRVPDRVGLLLGTNSAGSLKIEVDNKSVPSIGPRGASRDNVFLNPMLLREGRAAPR